MKPTVEEFRLMHTYIMQRTQISLMAEERRALDAESARTGKSLSALIREAVEAIYGTMRSSSDDLDLMRQAFGSWSDHNEDGASFVDKFRSGSRLTHHG
jgi:predicted DNA-binding protein